MRASRVFLIIHEADIRRAAAVLCRHSELELEDPPHNGVGEPWHSQAEILSSMRRRIEEALRFLGRHDDSARGRQPEDDTGDAAENEPMLQGIEERIERFKEKRDRLKEAIGRLETMTADVRKLLDLDIGVDAAASTELLYLTLGLVPNARWKRLTVALARTPALVLPLIIEADYRLIAAAAGRNHAAVVLKILQSIGFRELTLPENRSGPAIELLPQLEGRLAEQKVRLALLNRKFAGFAKAWRGRLNALQRKVQGELDRVERIGRHRRTGSFYSVEGQLARGPSEPAAFDLVREVRDNLQHPYTILMIPLEATGEA